MRLTTLQHIPHHCSIGFGADNTFSICPNCGNDTGILIKNRNVNARLFLDGINDGKVIVNQMLSLQERNNPLLFFGMIISFIYGIIPHGYRMTKIFQSIPCLHI